MWKLFIWICIQDRVLFTRGWRGEKGRIFFISHHAPAPAVGPKLAYTKAGAVSQGDMLPVSKPQSPVPPPQEGKTCQRRLFNTIHTPVFFPNTLWNLQGRTKSASGCSSKSHFIRTAIFAKWNYGNKRRQCEMYSTKVSIGQCSSSVWVPNCHVSTKMDKKTIHYLRSFKAMQS